MRINCILGPFLPIPPVLGGSIEKIFLALCEEFSARGHEVAMLSRRFRDFPNENWINGVRHIRVPSRDRPHNALAFRFFDILYTLQVRKALPPADITITNSVSAPLLIPRSTAGKIYVDVARYPKRQMGIYRHVDRLQCCSTHIARAVCEQTPSVAHLVKAIPNALTSIFAATSVGPMQHDRAKEVVFVGRVAREKGLHLLIRAFALVGPKFPDWRLVVVGPHLASQGGDGDGFLQELRGLAAAAGVEAQFVGPIFDERALEECYSRSSIFVYPSIAERGEAFPVAPLEAMACGCAPVVSDLRCFDDAITAEVNGLIFDHRDPSGKPLAEVLERLMSSDTLRHKIAEGAKQKSRDYIPATVARLFLEDFSVLTGLPTDPVRPGANKAVQPLIPGSVAAT